VSVDKYGRHFTPVVRATPYRRPPKQEAVVAPASEDDPEAKTARGVAEAPSKASNPATPLEDAAAPAKADSPAAPVLEPPTPAVETPKPARSAPKLAATPKRKAAKRRTKRAKQRVITVKSTLLAAALARLRDEHPKEYSKGFAKASPAVLISQMRPIWADICKAAGVSPDHPLPKWDMVFRAIGGRNRRRRNRRRNRRRR